MSLTCAAGDLRQHDTSLTKSRDVASTPLSGCKGAQAPCTLHVALGRTGSGRLQDASGLRAEDRKRRPQCCKVVILSNKIYNINLAESDSISGSSSHVFFGIPIAVRQSLHAHTNARAF